MAAVFPLEANLYASSKFTYVLASPAVEIMMAIATAITTMAKMCDFFIYPIFWVAKVGLKMIGREILVMNTAQIIL
jgi:hypothetical protein